MKKLQAETKHDIFTIPNAITLGRLALSPFVAYRLGKNPAKRWPEALVFAASDNLDGYLARLGSKRPRLAALGFRESEVGRKADPLVDKVFGAEMLSAGLAGGVLASKTARTLAAVSLIQKAAVGRQTLRNERDGIELAVRKSGKYFEFLSNTGFGMQFIAESIDDADSQQQIRRVGLGLAAVGVAGAVVNTVRYRLEAEGWRKADQLLADFAETPPDAP